MYLSFNLLSQPTQGTLEGTPPSLTYDPKENYSGPDNFTFKVNDGKIDSSPATVKIAVESENRPPVAVGSWMSVAPSPPDKAFIGGQIKLDGTHNSNL